MYNFIITMKIALVHDYLNQYGGGERVLECLMEMFPEAPVYTLLHDVEKTGGRFESRVVKTSFLDFKFARRNHRWFIPLMPLAARSLNLGDKYDLIISDTAGFAKGIRYNRMTTKHISYIHTPLRYAWEQDTYLDKLLTKFQLRMTRPILNYLKHWDCKYGKRPDILLANSKFIGKKVKEYYGRPARVVFPPVDMDVFHYDEVGYNPKSKHPYYLAIGRVLHYKRFDLVVEAFKQMGLPLKDVCGGPELEKVRQLAVGAGNIEFINFINDENELRKLYAGAKALIFPQGEDFGLVAAEAQACGTPVIAYNDGGAMEIIENGKTGILFPQQSVESLVGAVELFQKKRFVRKAIAASAQRFSKEQFRKEIVSLI